jgi:hypothetical protein
MRTGRSHTAGASHYSSRSTIKRLGNLPRNTAACVRPNSLNTVPHRASEGRKAIGSWPSLHWPRESVVHTVSDMPGHRVADIVLPDSRLFELGVEAEVVAYRRPRLEREWRSVRGHVLPVGFTAIVEYRTVTEPRSRASKALSEGTFDWAATCSSGQLGPLS